MEADSELARRMGLVREHFRQGRYGMAENMLLFLLKARMPREIRLECANVARRAGFPALAARFLYARMRKAAKAGAVRSPDGPDDHERAEYAAALAVLGCASEAERIFGQIDFAAEPEAAFLRAVARMANWDYDGALGDLESYVRRAPNDSQRLAATIRLAMCRLRCGNGAGDASAVIEDVIRRAGEAERHVPQLIYALHVRAEHFYVVDRDPRAALREVEELEKRFPDHDATVPRIWKNLLLMSLQGEKPNLRRDLEREREAARKAGNWFVFRTSDFLEAFILKRERCLHRVCFGSPYPGLRRLVLARCGLQPGALPATYDWHEGAMPAVGKPWILDVDAGTHTGGEGYLKENQLMQRLLAILASDFYRPIPEAELHEKLYPGERYVPDQAARRVRVLVFRLRAWLKRERLPAQVVATDGAYRLVPGSRCVVRVPNPERAPGAAPTRRVSAPLGRAMDQLRRRFGEAPFSSAEAAKSWDISLRSAVYRLREALDLQLIEATGRGPATRYRAR